MSVTGDLGILESFDHKQPTCSCLANLQRKTIDAPSAVLDTPAKQEHETHVGQSLRFTISF